MGGAIIQLVAYGAQNIYLTGDPQITFYKSVYKRYTNFSMESIQQDIIGNLSPGNFVSVVIARNGDLLKDIYLQYNPSAIYKGGYVFYTDGKVPSNLGNTIFKQIEIEIGGNLIDRQYGVWLTIWSKLSIQSYIAPSPSTDNFLVYNFPTGAEPTVCNTYDRMSYNHNQLTTYLDYQFLTACLYTNPDPSKFRGMLAYLINTPTTIPTVGTFDLEISNIGDLITFENNPLNVIYLFYDNQIPATGATENYFIQFATLTTASNVTTFNNCVPYSPSTYPGSGVPIDSTHYKVSNVFEIYTGAINPADLSSPAITNIIPNNSTTLFNIRVNNPNNVLFNGSKGSLTIYSAGNYYNIYYGNPSGKSKYYSPEGYLVIYKCTVLNPPLIQVTLTGADLVVPTGTAYAEGENNLIINPYLINLLPTSGQLSVCATSPVDIYTYLDINGPLPVQQPLEVITLNGVKYVVVSLYYFNTAYYDPTTQLYYYFITNGFIVNGYPSVPTPVPNGTVSDHGWVASTVDEAPTEAYIPLQFWFCRNPGLALPLIALQYHEVKLNLLLATWQELHAFQYSDVDLSSIKVYADYIYLDTTERRQFAQNAHEYLIDQLQFDTFNNSFASNISGGQLQVNLNFSNCVKELIFCGTPVPYGIDSQGIGTPNKILNTTAETSNVQVQLKFNQGNRFSNRNIKYFTRNQIWDCHTGSGSSNALYGQVGTDSIGIYSFALKPGGYQPSGTCNFSRISKPQLVFSNFDTTNGEQLNSLNIYAVNYNILRIMSGMGNVAYAY
jgi:hypothetical protein